MERIQSHEIPKGLMEAMRQVETYLRGTSVDYSLYKLLKVRVSQINGCAYCLDMHYKEAMHAGESVSRLMLLSTWREAPIYTPKEKVVLDFAEKLTRIATEDLPEDLHDELKKFFSIEDIANLSLATAQINSWNRIMRSFGTTAGNYKVQ